MKVLSLVFFTIMLVVIILFLNHKLDRTFLGPQGSLVVLIIAVVAFITSFILDSFVFKEKSDADQK